MMIDVVIEVLVLVICHSEARCSVSCRTFTNVNTNHNDKRLCRRQSYPEASIRKERFRGGQACSAICYAAVKVSWAERMTMLCVSEACIRTGLP